MQMRLQDEGLEGEETGVLSAMIMNSAQGNEFYYTILDVPRQIGLTERQ